MSTQENGPAPDEPTAEGPEPKQHGDPLLSTAQGQPEEGSRQGETPPATPDGDIPG